MNPSHRAAPRALDRIAAWPGAAAAGVVRAEPDDPNATSATSPAEAGAVRVVDMEGDVDTPREWASVTKLLVALAVLVAVEEGTLTLDQPAGPPGATVRHLLAHASGLGPDSRAPLTAPGRRRIYSNAGYEVLGETLSDAAGMPLTDYLHTGVVVPLGMTGTSIAPGASPASGARGPLRNLLALGTELLHPTIVSPATLAEATSVAFPGLAGVLPGYGRFDPCDWGLGFEIKDAKTPHWTGARNAPSTFGHFGQSGSFVWVDPRARLSCGALSDRAFGPWAKEAWPTLADAVLLEWAGGRARPARAGHGDSEPVT